MLLICIRVFFLLWSCVLWYFDWGVDELIDNGVMFCWIMVKR